MLNQAEKVELSRFNMVEQQVRTWEVLDAKVLDLLQTLPREEFVPKEYKGLAFADIEIPLGNGRFMLSPKIEGRFLQALTLCKKSRVLEIGTGAGYLTALMAKQADVVLTYDADAKLMARAKKNLAGQKINNVKFFVADGLQVTEGIYDAIVMTASLPAYPKRMERLLALGGRMLVVVGSAPVMQAMLITRLTADSYHRDVLFETCLPQMDHAPQPSQFVF